MTITGILEASEGPYQLLARYPNRTGLHILGNFDTLAEAVDWAPDPSTVTKTFVSVLNHSKSDRYHKHWDTVWTP